MKPTTFSFLLACALAVVAPGIAQDAAAPATAASPAPPRYTFSWPLDGATLKPRGGTTKGAPIELDTAASAQQGVVTLKGAVDKLGLFHPLFERADEIEKKPREVNAEDDRLITRALEAMGVR